jgi:hypothetical protein
MVYQKRRKTQQGLAMTYSTPQRVSGSFDVIVVAASGRADWQTLAGRLG